MINMKVDFSAMISRVCAAGLAFLGFGCSSNDPGFGGGEIICMYGTPTGSWEIHGAVTDQAGNEIPEATVRVTLPDCDSDPYSLSVTETDAEGRYSLEGHNLANKLKVVCVPDDPVLESDSTIVDLEYKKDKKDKNGWYRGHAEATVEFRLKPKEEKEDSR